MALTKNTKENSLSRTAAWLISNPVHPSAECRLFCLPQAGGGAKDFDSWRQQTTSQIHVCAIQLPGRQDRFREKAFSNIGPLVNEIAEAIADNADLPFAIYGHCMGGLIAFELVHKLRRDHLPLPFHFFVSSYYAPQDAEVEVGKRKYLLPEEEFLKAMQQSEILESEVIENRELSSLLLPALRADYELCETYLYQPEPPFDFPMTVFGAVGDSILSEQGLQAWGRQTTGPFSLRMLAGQNPSLYLNPTLMSEIRDLLLNGK